MDASDRLAILTKTMRQLEILTLAVAEGFDTARYAPDSIEKNRRDWSAAIEFLDACYPGRLNNAFAGAREQLAKTSSK